MGIQLLINAVPFGFFLGKTNSKFGPNTLRSSVFFIGAL
jgi:hypothetical protein